MMKFTTIMTKVLLAIFLLTFAGLSPAAAAAPAPAKTSRKIVVYKKGVSTRQKNRVLGRAQARPASRLQSVSSADVVNLTAAQEAELAASPEVQRIDNDAVVRAFEISTQVLPWGVDRIDGEKVQPVAAGGGVRVGILDTGLDLGHPDLAAHIKGGYNAIDPGLPPADDSGHGTHVAGIVAAINNNYGVVGVAPDVDLYAIKSLGANGVGYVSDIMEGLEWAVSNNLQIVNMSFGLKENIPAFAEAIRAAYQKGLIIVAAAGNDGGAVKYPAVYPEVIAVAGVDRNDNLASFSSRGSEMDLAAPAEGIYSTAKGGGYQFKSGTSMAASHVAGSAALLLSRGYSARAAESMLVQGAQRLPSGLGLVDAKVALGAPVAPSIAASPASHLAGSLVNEGGTIWRITDDGLGRQAFDSAEKFYSHRYAFADVVPANPADLAKENRGIMPWGDGTLFNESGTIYQVAGGLKYGFSSAAAFLGMGFKFKNAIPGRLPIPEGPVIGSVGGFLPGTFVENSGTVYRITAAGSQGVPNPAVLASWGVTFDQVVRTYGNLPPATGTLAFRAGSFVNDNGVIFAIQNSGKVGFTSADCYTGLGYRFPMAIPGSTREIPVVGSACTA